MTWWMILLIILAVLWLLLQVRFGARAEYGERGFSAAVKVGPFRVFAVPRTEDGGPQKKKTPKDRKGKKKMPPKELKERKNGTFAVLMKMLPVICEALGALKRKIRINDLSLSVIWGGGEDPAAAAIHYGYAHGAIGMIWPLLDHNFEIKRSRFHVDVDYTVAENVIALDAAASLTLGQILSIAVRYGSKLLIYWAKTERPAKQ